MRVFISIDDTDNIGTRGTGALASMLAETIVDRGWGTAGRISRHQLFVHPDIPYTSHNSSMCFVADIYESALEDIKSFAADFLVRESAAGSDPGLCIAAFDKIMNCCAIMDFGKKAKQMILSKEEAYSLSKELGIHLSEHGGTGQGVIGALAAVGLRLSGNDGRFKGKIQLECENGKASVGYILTQTGFDRVKDFDGDDLGNDEIVLISDVLKAVLLDNKSTLLVFSKIDENSGNAVWQTFSKQQLKIF